MSNKISGKIKEIDEILIQIENMKRRSKRLLKNIKRQFRKRRNLKVSWIR